MWHYPCIRTSYFEICPFYYIFSFFTALTNAAHAPNIMNMNGNAAANDIVCNGFNPPAIRRPIAITD